MRIKNFAQLATSPLRKDALEIIDAGLAAIDTNKIIKHSVKLHDNKLLQIKDTWLDITKYRRVYFIGIGKAAYEAARSIESILGEWITDGIALDIKGKDLKKIRTIIGSHPHPTQANVSATREIISLLQSAKEEDLIIALVSGGGSALLCSPYQISCDEKAAIVESMVNAGANIEEVNTVRKHLSEIKGGFFAKHAYPSKLISLIISDVPGNDISLVASGPTVLDTTTVAEAAHLMTEYDVLKICRLPHCDLTETPKDPMYFQLVTNTIIGDERLAIDAMRVEAVKREYKPEVFSYEIEGKAVDVAKKLVLNSKPRSAILAAGETTVEVKKGGKGGRNQHLVLATLGLLKKDQIVISINSDGMDHSSFAGAIGDKKTVEEANKKKLSPEKFLQNTDSFNFFKKVGGGIETGLLGTNISDFMLVLSK